MIISGAPGYSWVRLKVHDVGRSVAPKPGTSGLLWHWRCGVGTWGWARASGPRQTPPASESTRKGFEIRLPEAFASAEEDRTGISLHYSPLSLYVISSRYGASLTALDSTITHKHRRANGNLREYYKRISE